MFFCAALYNILYIKIKLERKIMKNIINETENPEFLTKFLNYKLIIENMSEGTVKEYNYDLLLFLRYIAFRKEKNNVNIDGEIIEDESRVHEIDISRLDVNLLSKITLDDIHSFLAFVKKNYDNSANTIARRTSSIRSFFKYYSSVNPVLKQNVASNLESPKLPQRLPRHLDIEEAKRLLESTKTATNKKAEKYIPRNHAIITIFINCGLRLNELVNINISDINFETRFLKVTGKGNKERSVYLNDACMKALDRYIKTRPENISKEYKDALFLSNQNKRISRRGVQYIVENEMKKAGLDTTKFSTHKLRHTAATLMYQYGDVDIAALQKVLGHENISTTEIYTHAESYEVKRAIENNPLANLD